jgi:tRNA(fMet)-specific endonuclease VapC
MNFIWDTNILLNCVRNDAIYNAYDEKYGFFSKENRSFISIVSVGEIYSIAHQRNWQKRKRQKLKEIMEFLGRPLPIANKQIVEIYSRIDAYSQGKLIGNPLPKEMSARNMGKNDVWIAATAHVLDLKLVTTDKDFDHLQGIYLDILTL